MDELYEWIDWDTITRTPVSLSRERESHLDTNVHQCEFTCEQLDTIAPLSLKDQLSLRNDAIPTAHARQQIRLRAEAARTLKYPRERC